VTKEGNSSSLETRYLAALSALTLGHDAEKPTASAESLQFKEALRFVSEVDEVDLHQLLHLAQVHHVPVRFIQAVQGSQDQASGLTARLAEPLAAEHKRIGNALAFINRICEAFEKARTPLTVIKSLDHWPDLGGDIDLYTSGDRQTVLNIFCDEFGAKLEPQSWGDRLANKWNFQLPGLPELVECHVKWLGQTGEQVALAKRLEERRVRRQIGDYEFPVPAPEERIIVATLQRMYRHFYIRLCDIINIANLIRSRQVDYAELKKTADLGAIWPGVATLLVIVADYVRAYGGTDVSLPSQVLAAARFNREKTFVNKQFLRIPIVPHAAELYTQQMIGIGASHNFRSMLRLSLLPALATAAFVGFRLTGSDKGIW
jgi:hypothetical protein